MSLSPANTIVFNELSSKLINELVYLNDQKFLQHWSLTSWIKEISNEASRVIIAYDGRRLVGFALIHIDPFVEYGHLVKIATCPSMIGRGIGTSIMTEVVGFARQLNLKLFSLDVCTDNERAIKLYEVFNFKVLHERKKYYSDGGDSYLMELRFQ